MGWRPWACLLLLVATVPSAEADPVGTEVDPEMVDSAGDVRYDQTYIGPRNLDYLDMLGGWWSHDNATDRVILSFKAVDFTAHGSRRAENEISCGARATFSTSGNPTGNVSFGWVKNHGRDEFRSHVTILRFGAARNVVSPNGEQAPHEFMADLGRPGRITWAVDRALLLQHGDALDSLSGSCAETGFVGAGGTYAETYQNRDDAISKSAYSLRTLRRVAGPDGAKDPIEAYTPTPEPSPTLTQVETTASGMALVCTVLFAVAAHRRRR